MNNEITTGLIGLIAGILIGFSFTMSLITEDKKQPTVECTDGKLYDVSYEGNITIYEKRPFTTCEER